MTLYDEIGVEFVSKAIREFYSQAVVDPIIGHFFFNVEIEQLISKQIDFTSRMLGMQSAEAASSRPLKTVHHPLHIRGPHFSRRQKLMASVLESLGLDEKLRKQWLALEAQLKPHIVNKASKSLCSGTS